MVSPIRDGTLLAGVGKQLLRRLVDSFSHATAVIRSDGAILYHNLAFVHLAGNASSALKIPWLPQVFGLSSIASFKFFLQAPTLDQSFENVSVATAKGKIFLSGRIFKPFPGRNLIFCELSVANETRASEVLLSPIQRHLIDIGLNVSGITHALKGAHAALTGIVSALPELIVKRDMATLERYALHLTSISDRIGVVLFGTLKVSQDRKVEFKEIDLYALVQRLGNSDEITDRLDGKDIEIAVSGSCRKILAAEQEITIALANIIINAIEAISEIQRQKGVIIIDLKDEKDGISIAISDNGPGIPPDNMGMIFNFLHTTKPGGSGFGLPIAKRYVEDVHHGVLSVTSQVGEGTIFKIFIPTDRTNYIASIPEDYQTKIRSVLLDLSRDGEEDLMFAKQVIDGMKHEHILATPKPIICEQIRGQILRLRDFLKTGIPYVSVNNLSQFTEVVVAADRDSTDRDFWIGSLKYELERLKLGQMATVRATRTLRSQSADCRVFEIRRFRGAKLTEPEKEKLEMALREKITPLPTLEEFEVQRAFIASALSLLGEQDSGAALSLIFNPSVQYPSKLRLAGLQLEFSPRVRIVDPRPYYLYKHARIGGMLFDIADEVPEYPEILSTRKSIDPNPNNPLRIDRLTRGILIAFDLKTGLLTAFRTKRSGMVVNLLCSSQNESTLPDSLEQEFLALNYPWVRIYQENKSTLQP